MGVEVIGFGHAIERCRAIAHRMDSTASALAPELLVMEAEEKAIFAELHGRFVDTGRAERSLTTGSGDSVRLVHGAYLEFGTTLEYVRYLTKEREGRHHRGANAVLLSGFEAKEGGAPERILKRIVGE